MLEQVKEPSAGPGVPMVLSLEMRDMRCSTWGSVGGTTLDSRVSAPPIEAIQMGRGGAM